MINIVFFLLHRLSSKDVSDFLNFHDILPEISYFFEFSYLFFCWG